MNKLFFSVLLLCLTACGDNQSNVSLPSERPVSAPVIENGKYLGLTEDQILGGLMKAVDSKKTEQVETGEVATIYMFQKSFAPGFIQIFNPDNPTRTKFTMIVPDDRATQHKLIGAGIEFLGNTVPLLADYEKANNWFSENLNKTISKGDVGQSTEIVGNRKVTISYAKGLALIAIEVSMSQQTNGVHPEYSFKINKIDTRELIKGLNIGKRQKDESDNGNARFRWNINGVNLGRLEAIGDPKNAEIFSGQCWEYDNNGNSIGWPDGGRCATLFRGVMANILHDSNPATDYALATAGLQPYRKGEFSVNVEAQHLSLELHNDGFFFLRNRLLKK